MDTKAASTKDRVMFLAARVTVVPENNSFNSRLSGDSFIDISDTAPVALLHKFEAVVNCT